MDFLLKVYGWAMGNLPDLISAVAHLVLFGSVIVKMTPTLKDDAYFKPIIKFLGKYIAWNKYGPGPTP